MFLTMHIYSCITWTEYPPLQDGSEELRLHEKPEGYNGTRRYQHCTLNLVLDMGLGFS